MLPPQQELSAQRTGHRHRGEMVSRKLNFVGVSIPDLPELDEKRRDGRSERTSVAVCVAVGLVVDEDGTSQ
jgi:hypothetical protein